MAAERVVFGYRKSYVTDIRDVLNEAANDHKAEFIVVPLFHNRLRRDKDTANIRLEPKTRSDRELSCRDWTSNIVGEISSWIDLCSCDIDVARSSEIALREETAWATHLSLQAILCPTPRFPTIACIANYGRCIKQTFSLSAYLQYWVRIPLVKPLDSLRSASGCSQDVHHEDGWHIWNHLRTAIGHSHRVVVALELSTDLGNIIEPTASTAASEPGVDLACIYRWISEPVKALIIPTHLFLTNRKGFPVLSKAYQTVISIFLRLKIHVIFTGKPLHCAPDSDVYSYLPYTQYIQFLLSKLKETLTKEERQMQSYNDTLQSPLQPLMDNLEAQTYETFENDSIKYVLYQEAIAQALHVLKHNRTVSGCGDPIVVTVVGAGRGPLVAAALSAALTADSIIRVFAIEKNENAIITLRNRVKSERWTNVTIISTDMRNWKPSATELADIMVSELLGSWGDNELSPECLDGAQVCLKEGGISIPTDYVSYIAPMSSAKLWMGARDLGNTPQPLGTYAIDHQSLDSPYVVKLHNWCPLAEPMPLFRFEHPVPNQSLSQIDNSRFSTVSFQANCDATLHGFSGTFESKLYGHIYLSTRPCSHTPNMYSWFPLFIPLSCPISVKRGDTITVNIWRCVSPQKIWYEWALASPLVTPIQNSGGKSYWIGLW